VLAVGLAGVGLAVAFQGRASTPGPKSDPLPAFLEEFQAGQTERSRVLPLFLDDFRAPLEPPAISKQVRFPSMLGEVTGFWARQDVPVPLPAVLMVYDDESWTEWMKASTIHLASVGNEVLTIDLHRRRVAAAQSPGASSAFANEATLAELSAAVRWLRCRSGVLPNRTGVVGWGWSGGQALVLASATSLQACVVCDAPLPSEPGIVAGLRETPVLGVFAAEDFARRKEAVSAFRRLLADHRTLCNVHVAEDVRIGFMGPPTQKSYSSDAAEDAWFVIYNFLEKHVEDARTGDVSALSPVAPIATVADIMRAVNDPSGLRGALGTALEHEPGNVKEWRRIRADAALVAEAGGWLAAHPPAKGSAAHWNDQARAFTSAAEAIVEAADKRDYAAARRGLVRVAQQCSACHLEHR
jgi:dienelactone hydrolase